MNTRKLSDQKIIEYVIEYTKRFGFPPTSRDVAAHFGVHPSTVSRHIAQTNALTYAGLGNAERRGVFTRPLQHIALYAEDYDAIMNEAKRLDVTPMEVINEIVKKQLQ